MGEFSKRAWSVFKGGPLTHHILYTVFCSLKQPKQKRPRGFSLPAFQVAIGGSKSVEKTILQQRPLGATTYLAQLIRPGRAALAVLISL